MVDPAEADREQRGHATGKVLCSVEGCTKPKHGLGFCAAHLSRFRRYGDPLKVSERLPLRTAWLLAQVETRDRTHCWDWPFWRDRKGYGEVNVNSKHWRAHALALVLDGKPRPKPPSHHALHSCDNPACVNPDHVRWGTHQENVADAVARDRNTKGERVPQHRLTEDQVRSIRKDSRTLKAIADEYGVCFQTIGTLEARDYVEARKMTPEEEEREQRGQAASSALELASHAYLTVEPDLREDIAEYPLEYALDVLSYLEALQSATRAVRKQVEEYVAEQLKPATYYRHRDSIVKVGGSGAWKVKEEPVNNGLLAFYIGKDWPTAVNLKAAGAITKSRIEALEKQRILKANEDADEVTVNVMVQEMVHNFFEYKKNDSAISTMPLEKAPNKTVAALSPGERYIPKPKKPAKPRLEASK